MRQLLIIFTCCILSLQFLSAQEQTQDPEQVQEPSTEQVQDSTKTEQPPQVNGTIDYSAVKEYEIGGIKVIGPKFLDEKILITFSGLSVGDKIQIPGEQIPNAMKALWRNDLFADVQIQASKIVGDVVFLEYHLTELPRLARYKFEGVRKGEVDGIRDIIPLIAGKVISQNVKNTTIQKIKRYYADKGFLNADVVIKDRPDKRPNRVVLDIIVERNKKIRIEDIVITGNENMLPRKIKRKLGDTKERTRLNPKTPILMFKDLRKARVAETLGNVSIADALNYFDDKLRLRLFSSSKFIDDKYEADKQKLIDFYNAKGYRDARIVRDSVYYSEKTGNLIIDLEIEEGQKYYFRNIEWVGNTKYDDEQLAQRLGISLGDTYNQDLMQQRLYMDPESGDVSSLYMDDGYLFFNVNPVETLVEGDSIDLEMRVYEGPQATINNVIIKGNNMTNEHVVRRALRTKPGNKFRRSDIIRSQREIANLGYFNQETIGINPIPNPSDGTVDIEYSVEEKPSDQLTLSAGWGGNTVYGNVGVMFNNFSMRNITKPETWQPLPKGDGQTLSINLVSNGRPYQSISLAFTEPWLGGKQPISLTVALNRTRNAFYDTRGFTNLRDAYRQDPTSLLRNTRATVEIGKRLKWPDDYFTLVASANFSMYQLTSWPNFIVTNGNFYNLSLKATLSRTSIDAPIYPRSGSLFSVSVEATPPYSAISGKDFSQITRNEEKFKFPEFHKWKLKAEWYTNIWKNLVLKTSAKMGFLGYYNGDIGYAPFERFQLGGDGLSQSANQIITGLDIIALRGYEDTDITDNIVNIQDNSVDENGNPIASNNGIAGQTRVGDPFFSKYTLELRYPLSLNPSSTVYALSFLEAGNSWSDFREFNPFELRRSAGLGIRIFLPMFGMLGFDYGVGFDQNFVSDGSFGNYLSTFGKFSFILGFEPE